MLCGAFPLRDSDPERPPIEATVGLSPNSFVTLSEFAARFLFLPLVLPLDLATRSEAYGVGGLRIGTYPEVAMCYGCCLILLALFYFVRRLGGG